jgi:hypothetical protein
MILYSKHMMNNFPEAERFDSTISQFSGRKNPELK